ncbi:hypothetical protein AV530_016839 [Patagioenas fasciata monilis]|uniref:Uncharacterized protein n=1 Tax=Patagioenas fasciata monilis TaxID=372326 RepID=A0A1V4J3Y0_PATFA|nr:hypothetical protein AV530_016839 [Patagioenas fasciata monilis]
MGGGSPLSSPRAGTLGGRNLARSPPAAVPPPPPPCCGWVAGRWRGGCGRRGGGAPFPRPKLPLLPGGHGSAARNGAERARKGPGQGKGPGTLALPGPSGSAPPRGRPSGGRKP